MKEQSLWTTVLCVFALGCNQSFIQFRVDAGEDAGVDAGCMQGLTLCGDQCVDIENDDDHCGACAKLCLPDEACERGICQSAVACDPGAACSPTNDCHVGQVSCIGRPTCEDQQLDAPNGTACDGGSCFSGNCTACNQGGACDGGNPCHEYEIDCSTGLGVCADTTRLKPDGTSCGAGQVCSSGACASCSPGAECLAADPCRIGVTSCSSGPSCTNTGALKDAGVSCGLNQVCSVDGGCTICQAGNPCSVAGAECSVGVTSCATGELQCIPTGNKVDGALCSTGICIGGSCSPCVAGQACATSDCVTGITSCPGTGAMCGSLIDRPAGTRCDFDAGVCVGSSCVSCIDGRACIGNPSNCHLGVESCGPTGVTCVNGATKPVGTRCNLDAGVCDSSGACNACTPGMSCQPTNPCKNGATTCTTGMQTCEPGSNKPNNTECQTSKVCKAGTCSSCTSTLDCSGNKNCIGGNCVPPLASCDAIRDMYGSAAPDGEYHLTSSRRAYCDMAQRVPLCMTGNAATRTGRMRDGSGLPYSIISRMTGASFGTGSCEFWNLKHSTNDWPFDSDEAICRSMGFKGTNVLSGSGCLYGDAPTHSSCGYPNGPPFYRYGISCAGCSMNNGMYASFVLQGPMTLASVTTDAAGNRRATCAIR